MAHVIRVVVSCTERKRVAPQPFLRAAELTRVSFDSRIAMWLERISAAQRTHRALDLYQGEHWATARKLVEDSPAEVWVASAGYGLLNANARLASYGATFASGQPDSIMLAGSGIALDREREAWWKSLQIHASAGRCDASLMSLATDGPVIVAASRPYLAAMEQDLLDAAAQPGSFVSIATIGPVPATLQDLRTAGSGIFTTVLGGSMLGVSTRLASKIVECIDEADLTRDAVNELTEKLMAKASPLVNYGRLPLTDEEVSSFVAKALKADSPPSCSALLRSMRDSGVACEQSRFRRLYWATRGAQ
jgi:hypothetical protein